MEFLTQQGGYLYILLALVIVLVIAAPALKRILRNKAEIQGRKMGMSLEEKIHHKDLTQLNRVLEFPDAEQGYAVIKQVLSHSKKVTAINETLWHAKELHEDDLHITWQEITGIGQFKVSQIRAFGKTVMGGSQWKKIVEKITSQADQAGIVYREATQVLQPTGEEVEGDEIWAVTE